MSPEQTINVACANYSIKAGIKLFESYIFCFSLSLVNTLFLAVWCRLFFQHSFHFVWSVYISFAIFSFVLLLCSIVCVLNAKPLSRNEVIFSFGSFLFTVFSSALSYKTNFYFDFITNREFWVCLELVIFFSIFFYCCRHSQTGGIWSNTTFLLLLLSFETFFLSLYG